VTAFLVARTHDGGNGICQTSRMIKGITTLYLSLALLAGSTGCSETVNFQSDYEASANGLAAYNTGDYATALPEFQRLAKQGNVSAQVMMGEMFEYGRGVQQDYLKAEQWYREAATRGHAKAQHNLGDMYSRGEGLDQDDALAVHWYRKAAERGLWASLLNLGDAYSKGKGVPEDAEKGFQYFKLAAETGAVIAQYRLAFRYADGAGVERNLVFAHMWWNLATLSANRGPSLQWGEEVNDISPAQIAETQRVSLQLRDVIARGMTPEQIGEAGNLARDCARKKFKGC